MMPSPTNQPVPSIMPSAIAAEQALLAMLLLDSTRLVQVASLLQPEQFTDPIHGMIYLAIHKAADAGMVADVAVIRAEFEGTGLLDEAGGAAYLAQLAALRIPAQISIHHYAKSVHDAWLRRRLISVAEHLHALAADTLQGAYGESASDFGDVPGTEQAAFVATRLRGLLASVEAAVGTMA